MSLINDALKRASQTTKDRPAQATLSTAMEPVQAPARPRFNFGLLGIPVAVAILVASGWFFLKWYRQRHAAAARPPAVAASTITSKLVPVAAPKTQAPNPVSQQQPAAPGASASAVKQAVVSPANAIVPASAPIAPAARPPVAAAPVAPQPQPPPATVPATIPVPAYTPPPAPQPAVPFPTLQVKGIFYNRAHPTALINGDTVGVGERVLGVRIVQIQPDRVVLELNGHTKTLLLGE